MERARVQLIWFRRTRRHTDGSDDDNWLPKPIFDAMKGVVYRDDNHACLTIATPRFEVDAEAPRLEILIEG